MENFSLSAASDGHQKELVSNPEPQPFSWNSCTRPPSGVCSSESEGSRDFHTLLTTMCENFSSSTPTAGQDQWRVEGCCTSGIEENQTNGTKKKEEWEGCQETRILRHAGDTDHSTSFQEGNPLHSPLFSADPVFSGLFPWSTFQGIQPLQEVQSKNQMGEERGSDPSKATEGNVTWESDSTNTWLALPPVVDHTSRITVEDRYAEDQVQASPALTHSSPATQFSHHVSPDGAAIHYRKLVDASSTEKKKKKKQERERNSSSSHHVSFRSHTPAEPHDDGAEDKEESKRQRKIPTVVKENGGYGHAPGCETLLRSCGGEAHPPHYSLNFSCSFLSSLSSPNIRTPSVSFEGGKSNERKTHRRRKSSEAAYRGLHRHLPPPPPSTATTQEPSPKQHRCSSTASSENNVMLSSSYSEGMHCSPADQIRVEGDEGEREPITMRNGGEKGESGKGNKDEAPHLATPAVGCVEEGLTERVMPSNAGSSPSLTLSHPSVEAASTSLTEHARDNSHGENEGKARKNTQEHYDNDDHREHETIPSVSHPDEKDLKKNLSGLSSFLLTPHSLPAAAFPLEGEKAGDPITTPRSTSSLSVPAMKSVLSQESLTSPAMEKPSSASTAAQQEESSSKIPTSTGRNVYVASLPATYDTSQLYSLFSRWEIEQGRLALDQDGKCKGYGFVMFATCEDANEAVRRIHGKLVEGTRIQVRLAREEATMKVSHHCPSSGGRSTASGQGLSRSSRIPVSTPTGRVSDAGQLGNIANGCSGSTSVGVNTAGGAGAAGFPHHIISMSPTVGSFSVSSRGTSPASQGSAIPTPSLSLGGYSVVQGSPIPLLPTLPPQALPSNYNGFIRLSPSLSSSAPSAHVSPVSVSPMITPTFHQHLLDPGLQTQGYGGIPGATGGGIGMKSGAHPPAVPITPHHVALNYSTPMNPTLLPGVRYPSPSGGGGGSGGIELLGSQPYFLHASHSFPVSPSGTPAESSNTMPTGGVSAYPTAGVLSGMMPHTVYSTTPPNLSPVLPATRAGHHHSDPVFYPTLPSQPSQAPPTPAFPQGTSSPSPSSSPTPQFVLMWDPSNGNGGSGTGTYGVRMEGTPQPLSEAGGGKTATSTSRPPSTAPIVMDAGGSPPHDSTSKPQSEKGKGTLSEFPIDNRTSAMPPSSLAFPVCEGVSGNLYPGSSGQYYRSAGIDNHANANPNVSYYYISNASGSSSGHAGATTNMSGVPFNSSFSISGPFASPLTPSQSDCLSSSSFSAGKINTAYAGHGNSSFYCGS